MHITRQTGTLEDYRSLFEERVAQLPSLPSLPPEQYLGMFLGGLQPSIRDRISDSEMSDVFAAIRAARRIARAHKPPAPQKSAFSSGVFTRPTASFHGPSSKGQSVVSVSAKSQPQSSSTGSSGFKGNRNARHLSIAEQREYRAQGKCFHCGLPYSPLHKCPAKSLAVILEAEDSDQEDAANETELPPGTGAETEDTQPELQHLQLSRLSSNGFDGAQTLKLFTRVDGRQLLTMIDSGASHCFIGEHAARALNLAIEPSTNFTVMLGDGTKISAHGSCSEVPFIIDGHLFRITCYIFPLRTVDVILGVSWLAQLGDVTANWAKLTMEFCIAGRKLCLRGDPSLTRRACVRADLCSLAPEDEAWLLCLWKEGDCHFFLCHPCSQLTNEGSWRD